MCVCVYDVHTEGRLSKRSIKGKKKTNSENRGLECLARPIETGESKEENGTLRAEINWVD